MQNTKKTKKEENVASAMPQTQMLVKTVVNAIQDKKGRNIVTVDMSNIENAICKYFVICEATNTTQVDAIAGEVSDKVRETMGQKAIGASGLENCLWVAIDFSDVMVHVFMPQARAFYDLEHLWADATLTQIPNLD